MPIVERRITIRAAPEVVWDVLSDVRRQPLWMHDLKSVRLQSDEPVGVGTRGIGTVRMFGVTESDPVEIVAFHPPRHFAVRHLGRFQGVGEFRLEPTPSGATRVVWREELVPSPDAVPIPSALRGVAGPLVRLVDALAYPVFASVFRADLRRLKALVEGGRSADVLG